MANRPHPSARSSTAPVPAIPSASTRGCVEAFLASPGPAGAFRVIGPTPAGTTFLACWSGDGAVMRIAGPEPGAKSETLHEECAPGWFGSGF